MCLAIPAQIREVADPETRLAVADVLGTRRRINVDLLRHQPLSVGDWVLVHVGFAMSRISADQAAEQIRELESLGEAVAAQQEAAGYAFGESA